MNALSVGCLSTEKVNNALRILAADIDEIAEWKLRAFPMSSLEASETSGRKERV